MTETKIYCDHCGKEITEFDDYCDYEVAETIHCDLCVLCKNKLLEIIKEFINRD